MTESLKSCIEWMAGKTALDQQQYCMTRDVFEGRLSKIPLFLERNSKISVDRSYLLTAVLGEIGNNCFDHNMGHWRDLPGAFFGFSVDDKYFMSWIADRGRGIAPSLRAVHKIFKNDQEALDAAFSKKISGRFPENRGNGLKFVRQIVNSGMERGLFCISDSAQIEFGKLGSDCKNVFMDTSSMKALQGTLTIIVWSNQ